jgi:hypothetical protein
MDCLTLGLIRSYLVDDVVEQREFEVAGEGEDIADARVVASDGEGGGIGRRHMDRRRIWWWRWELEEGG